MKKEFIDAINEGEIVKMQEFETTKGTYMIVLVRKGTDIFFFKHLDRELVECCNLSKLEGRRIE